MARSAVQKIYADFRQGFVTVANPLAYPEGSLKDIINFDIQDNGTIRLRPGLQQESSVAIDTGVPYSDVESKAISSFIWSNVNNVGADKIAVVQVGTLLFLFNIYRDRIALDEQVSAPINLGIGSEQQSVSITGASGSGWFFITHPAIKPQILKKDANTNTFSLTPVDIKIRDLSLWRGKTDEESGLVKGTRLYPIHEYNLRNGGWPDSTIVSSGKDPNDGVSRRDPVQYTRDKIGNYPAVFVPFNAGRAGGGDTLDEQNAFSPWAIDVDYFGNSLIPLGHFIVNAEKWSRVGEGETPHDPNVVVTKNLNRTYEWTEYPSGVEFYADRVWYCGAKGYREYDTPVEQTYDKKDNLDVSNTIYFSQQLNSDLEKVGFCYQQNDPTAEDINQLLATDGGTITIRGAGEIYSMKTFGTALVVFASEGVWAITGLDANSFKADSYSVDKISNIGPASKYTISSTDKNIYYIANDAIYFLTVDQISGKPTPQDITSGKIKDYYNNLSYTQKKNSKAFFDVASRDFYMLYSDSSEKNLFNKALVFNQDLGAFYKYEMSSVDRYIFDGVFYNKDAISSVKSAVTVDGVKVTLDGETVYLESTFSTKSQNTLQLLTVSENATTGNIDISFSSFSDTDKFEDWGVPYTGSVEFGFEALGDIMRDSIQAPAIISHMERTEDGFEIDPNDPELKELIPKHPSSCYMRTGWDWATNYGRRQQLYRYKRPYIPYNVFDSYDTNTSVITTKNRIRGKGHSLGLSLSTEAGKDCRILGIGIMYTVADRI